MDFIQYVQSINIIIIIKTDAILFDWNELNERATTFNEQTNHIVEMRIVESETGIRPSLTAFAGLPLVVLLLLFLFISSNCIYLTHFSFELTHTTDNLSNPQQNQQQQQVFHTLVK